MIKKNKKSKLASLLIISIILFSGITPILSNNINKLNSNPKESGYGVDPYLYLDEVQGSSYFFRAEGECYIIVEIDDIDFTSFMIDGEAYNVSYGLNIIPIEFANDPYASHNLEIDPLQIQYFKSLTVEPLFIAEDEINVNLDQETEINFKAGGPISILTRINFSYNWLRVELQNQSGGRTVIKRVHDTDEYPEIDPLFYCLFIERGTYIRYDLNIQPGEYTLILQGNGSIEYKILVNSDWDEDMISDVDEIQQEDKYDFNLDPTIPDIWGFYEKSDQNLLSSALDDESFTEGYFSFYIPEYFINNTLFIRFNSGEFKEIVVDTDSVFFEGEVFISDQDSPSDEQMYGPIRRGWHHISYQHKANFTSDIEFALHNVIGSYMDIKVLQFSEFRDTDGDGVKDLVEYSNSLNPAKTDTDEDGIPDNLDGSPLAKLELDPNQIHQFVLSTNASKDTLINIQIKKPETDYSTNGVPRLWRGAVNVSIYPVLRMFGNRYEDINNPEVYNLLDKSALEDLWGKNLNCIFKSDDLIYNENGEGDPLPGNEPDSEFYFIYPKSASETIDYDIMIPKEHSSKDDGLIDLRFDLIWLLTQYDFDTGETSLLHYYNFEEPIIVQSMTMREISRVHYTLGNPDSFIENQILWTLTQNPSLGSFEYFGVDNDTELSGIIDYFKLPERIFEYRSTVEYDPNEAEVLYMKGFYQNHDILNQIRLRTLENPDFETIHQGDFSAGFSSYSISNRYEDQAYFLGDPEIQGETKILYQLYSSANDQQSTAVMGVPIAMERSASSHTLKISQIQGFLDPLEEIPWDGSQLNNKTTILHQTYIERNDQMTGIPLVHFEEGVDVYKEHMDNRQNEVELSHQFFTAQPEMPAELFMNYIEELWENMALVKYNLSLLYDFVNNNPDYFVPGVDRVDLTLIENMINEITEFQQHSYSEISSYTEFFQFSQNLHIDAIELINLYQGEESNNLVSAGFFKKLSKVVKLAKIFPKIAKLKLIFSKLGESVNDIRVKDIPKQNIASQSSKHPSMKTQQANTGIKAGVAGAGCVLLGIAMIIFALIEIHQLASNSTQKFQGLLALGALGSLVAGVLLFSEGVLLIVSAFSKTLTTSLKGAIKSLGKITLVLAIFMYALNLVNFVDRMATGEDVDIAMEIFSMTLSTATLAVALAVALGLTSTGIGALIGAAIAAVSVLVSWVNSHYNAPDLDFTDSCGTYFHPDTELNMRRNGGLEKGDRFVYYIFVENTGTSPVWMRARLRIKGDTLDGENLWTSWLDRDRWHSDVDRKKRPWFGTGQRLSGELVATIEDASPNLKYQLQFQADWRKINYYVLFYTTSRKELTREDWTVPFDMHALENTISDFYDHTSDYGTTGGLKLQFEEALEEYRYWDACETANLIIRSTEINQKISLYHYEYIEANSYLVSLGDDYLIQDVYKYHTNSLNEWENLLTNFYKQRGYGGWAALSRPYTPPEPTYDWGPGMVGFGGFGSFKPDNFEWNMMSYEESGGILYTNADPDWGWGELWMDNKFAGLSDAFEYRELRDNLIIKSNLSTDLNEQRLEYNATSGGLDVSFKMNINPYANPYYITFYSFPPYVLYGTDGEKIVDFNFTAPEGFSITPQNVFTGRLDSTINFNVVSDTPRVTVGVQYFNLSIYYEGGLIYMESVPFKVRGFSLVEFETHTAPDPIVPGQLFNVLDVINSGTFDEVLKIDIEGIPECFIYKDLYPEKFINGSLFLGLFPGDIIPGLLIKPPRHHTTSPGHYFYKFHAQDYVYNKFNETIEGMFEVAEFYDMDFQCADPDITIFDSQSALYTFNITNFGNVNQEFEILLEDIPFVDRYLSNTSILLIPGETKTFTLTLFPTEWGEQAFWINVTSAGNSSAIEAHITINDDDINAPEFSNFEIIDSPIDVYLNFEVLNEINGDDHGLSEIKIFIDDELILVTTPDSTETSFSFTFNDIHGDWFMQFGIHEIRVEITDNDDDVSNDNLTSIIYGTFETAQDDMMIYILWELNNLEDYINEELPFCFNRPLINSLIRSQSRVLKALEYYSYGCISKTVFLDELAKASLELSDLHTYILLKHNKIAEDVADYIFTESHKIRDHLSFAMGAIVGTETALELANILVDMSRFADTLFSEFTLFVALSIDFEIWRAVDELDKTLILMTIESLEDPCIYYHLPHAICKLESAKMKINWFLNHGWITEVQAENLLIEIDNFIDRLYNLNLIVM